MMGNSWFGLRLQVPSCELALLEVVRTIVRAQGSAIVTSLGGFRCECKSRDRDGDPLLLIVGAQGAPKIGGLGSS